MDFPYIFKNPSPSFISGDCIVGCLMQFQTRITRSSISQFERDARDFLNPQFPERVGRINNRLTSQVTGFNAA